jgi:uncharacterized protein
VDGAAGVRRLLKSCVRWRVGVRWYVLALVVVPALILVALLVPPGGVSGFREPVPLLVLSYVPALAIILLVGGPLAEEPGWRGFALPRLQRRLGPLAGSVVLGMLWGLWHLPLFIFVPGYNGAGTGPVGIAVPFAVFVGGETGLAVIFTWLFNNARGSVLLTLLLHASANTATGVALPTQRGFASLSLAYVVLAAVIVAGSRARLGYRAEDQDPTD